MGCDEWFMKSVMRVLKEIRRLVHTLKERKMKEAPRLGAGLAFHDLHFLWGK